MKILNLGSCNIDLVYTVDHIVMPKETISAVELQHFVGGKGLNQSVAIAKSGFPVYHAGCVGKDGEMLIDYMKSVGVDVGYINVSDESSGHAIIQIDKNGQNSILLFAGANYCVTAEYIDSVLSDFNEGDFIVLQNEISNLDYIVEKAHEKGMVIFLNPSPYNEKITDGILSKVSYLILNEVELAGITGFSDIKKGLEFLNNTYPDCKAVATIGEDGCIYSYKNTTVKQAAFNVKVVDTTAAGDTFMGYFISQTASNKTLEEALRTASMAAAITVSRKGAAPSIPLITEIKDFRGQH